VLVIINRQATIEDIVIPVETEAPELLFGNTEFEKVKNGIKIKQQAPWSGSVFLI
jgi:hypothetical protein